MIIGNIVGGIKGPKGDPGPQGIPGIAGQNGEKGEPGKDGKSAYEYAVEGGYKGTEQEFSKKVAEDHSANYVKDIINKSEEDTIIILNDSDEKPLKGLMLSGRTEQLTTTGAQLIERPYVDGESKTMNGVQFTVESDGGIRVKGTATADALFILSRQDFGNDSAFHGNAYVANGKTFSGAKDNVKLEYHGSNKMLYLYCDSGKTFNTVIYPQVQEGNTATPYEIYTGGKPSPSPEYPQEIVNAGKLNEETGKYEITVNVSSKNLFDIEKSKILSNWIKSDRQPGYSDFLIYTGINKRVTISTNVKLNSGLNLYLGIATDTQNYVYGWLYHSAGTFNDTITLTTTTDYIVLRCVTYGLDLFFNNIQNLQIEISPEKTSYQEHKSQAITLASDRPVTRWDKLEKRGDIWGWAYNSTIIDDLAEIVPDNTVIYGDSDKHFTVNLKNADFNYDKSKLVSETGVYISSQHTDNTYMVSVRTNGILIGVGPNDTIQTAKEHLHYRVIYNSTETEFVPLSESEQKALNELTTYYPTTVISIYDDRMFLNSSVSYVVDIKNYIDNKIAEVKTSIANTNAHLL